LPLSTFLPKLLFFSGVGIMVLKAFFFTVSVLSWVVLDGPATDKYEVDWRNYDPEGFGVSGEETGDLRVSGDRDSVKSSLKYREARNLSPGIAEGFKGNIPVHSYPFTALPTAPLFQASEKSFPKLNLMFAALGWLYIKFVAAW
jgi:hypothetical protein